MYRPLRCSRSWERTDKFDPLSVKHNSISWVHHDGKALEPSPHSPQPYNTHLSSVWINSVISGDLAADVSMLTFPDPAHILAGQHQHLLACIDLAGSITYPLSQTVLAWLENKVQVQRFFGNFKGNFKGGHFDSSSPPKRVFCNHISCALLAEFICDTILQRLATGAISIRGKVSEVVPPHFVMPLTVEPSKPRLCNDNRFLNL